MDNEYSAEQDDLHFCRDCREVSEGTFCPHCDHGRCDVCGFLVKKGEPFTRDPMFPVSCFCGDCSGEVGQPSVAELAGKLASHA